MLGLYRGYIGIMKIKWKLLGQRVIERRGVFFQFSIRRISCFPHARCAEITLENRRIEAYR